MDRNTYRQVDLAQVLTQAFPDAGSGDSVLITIYNLDANTTDVNAVAMTYEAGVAWTYAWTPVLQNNFIITYNNATQGVSHYEYVKVVGTTNITPAGSSLGSTLTVLRKAFLIQIDNYNANDLSGDASSGDLAVKSINKALQKIYSMVKDEKFMEAYPSTSLVSVTNQDYINLSAISDLDDIKSITDTTNLYPLKYIPFWKYREWSPDPSIVTGVPTHYTKLFERVYLYPRPSSAITYTTDFVKIYGDLSNDGDQALLPSKYNYWIYAEAEVEWYKMQDPYNIPQIVITERQRCYDIALADIMSGFNENLQAESIFDRQSQGRRSLYTPLD